MTEIVQQIIDELTCSYIMAGRKVPEGIDVVARSLADACRFIDRAHVAEMFKRARDIETIPTQKTLKDIIANYGEERLKYEQPEPGTNAIGYENALKAWLPDNPVARRVNRTEAIKMYCLAMGTLDEYTYLHITRHEKGGSVEWAYPDKVYRFDSEAEAKVDYLYRKYYKLMPQNATFPKDQTPTVEMKTPSAYQFRVMCAREGWIDKGAV